MPNTEEMFAFRRTVREFSERELAPNSRAWDEAGIFPKDLFKRFAALGFFGIHYPEEVGGSGLDFWYTAAYVEELAHARNAGVVMSMLVQSDMATPIINVIGTQQQKQEFLVPALQGERIAALAITEPDAGSDVAALRTTARQVGEDNVINGAKTYITNGTRADFMTLAVRTGDEGYGGVSLLLFPTDTPGFSVSKSLEKLGNWSSDTGLIFFENCKVPKRYLLGEAGQGFYYIMTNFQGERLVAALMATGAMQLMWQDALHFADERQAFGQSISRFQVWRHRLVDLATQIEAAKQLTYAAVDKFNRGEQAVREISMAKLFACELAQKVAYECMQIYGGAGYMAEYDIARAYRDVRLWTIGGGSSEIMKEIIAKQVGL
ncbi:MAG: acyl-CoA dehydrogenase family protein [Myxococcota bacterium]